MKNYQHTQFGSVIVFCFAVVGLAMLVAAAFLPNAPHDLFWIGAFILLIGVLFSSLTITIEGGLLRARFGPGLIRKTVRLAEIASVRPIPVRWWYGWGIRLTPHGWLYNVSGWKAVEITLRSGRQFCLGTDEPEDLLKAIQETGSETRRPL